MVKAIPHDITNKTGFPLSSLLFNNDLGAESEYKKLKKKKKKDKMSKDLEKGKPLLV